MTATLAIRFRDRKALDAINSSLLPDNIDLPEGMKLSQRKTRSDLIISLEIDGSSGRIETLISTLDELVSHVYSATKTLEEIGNLDDRHQAAKGSS